MDFTTYSSNNNNNNNQPCIIEVTVISAQGIKNSSSSFFSTRPRAFSTVSTTPRFSRATSNKSNCENVQNNNKLYITQVDYEGGVNPTWGYKFQLNLDGTFFSQRHSALYINLYSKNLMRGKTQLGWCAIPAADIVGGMLPAGTVGHLSYRLRESDGTWGHGVVNVGVKLLEGSIFVATPPNNSLVPHLPRIDLGQPVVGIPVSIP